MIHTSLPLKPRASSSAETIVTPLSIARAEGIRVLAITAINSEAHEVTTYRDLIIGKIGNFDHCFYDNDSDLINTFSEYLLRIDVHKKQETVICCQCGKFEEIAGLRMYNQRRVVGDLCTYCGSRLTEVLLEVLLTAIDWRLAPASCNKRWISSDLPQFSNRNHGNWYKLSKQSEPVKFFYEGSCFGIRHQVLWACGLVYLCEKYAQRDITLHFVHRVADPAYVCCCIAKMINPDLNIHLEGLPALWLPEKKTLVALTPNDLQRLQKGMLTSRKELKV